MTKLIDKILLSGKYGEKAIIFENEGRTNLNQQNYLNALFKPDLSLKTDFSEFAYFGGFRCAKSFSQQLVVYLLCTLYKHLKTLFVRDTYGQLESSVIKQFNDEFLPMGNYEYATTKRNANFDNKSFLSFRTFERDTDILSAEYDVI